jgi:hypothetical protein
MSPVTGAALAKSPFTTIAQVEAIVGEGTPMDWAKINNLTPWSKLKANVDGYIVECEVAIVLWDVASSLLALGSSSGNRSLSSVNRILPDVQAETFFFTGQPIIFGVKHLFDGHNRLTAFVLGNGEVITLVVRGISDEAIDYLDINAKAKSLTDILQGWYGYQVNAQLFAYMTKRALCVQQGKAVSQRSITTRTEELSLLKEIAESLQTVVEMATTNGGYKFRRNAITFIAWWYYENLPADYRPKVKAFLTHYSAVSQGTSDLGCRNPIVRLHNIFENGRIPNRKGANAKLTRERDVELIIDAFNKYINNCNQEPLEIGGLRMAITELELPAFRNEGEE